MTENHSAPARLPGTVLGNYRLVQLLGEGGMGQVYLAEHAKLKRKVALKLLLPQYAKNEDLATRFFAEARAVNAVESEHIVEITDFCEDGDDKFFVMELLDGTALSEEMGRGALPLSRCLDIAIQLARALEAVHDAGILHRDLKPDNVMLVSRGGRADFVKLLDFGIAKVLDEEAFADSKVANDTQDGAVMGTPAYVSPEQLKGEELDYRADIYAFGLLLFQMLTGQRPFRSRSLPELVLKQMTETPPSISDVLSVQPVPTALDSLVRRCLEKDRALRPPTMSHVRAELELVRDGDADDDQDVFAEASSSSAIDARRGEDMEEEDDIAFARPWESPAALAGAGVVGLVLLGLSVWAGVRGSPAETAEPAGAAAAAAVENAPASPRDRLIKRIDDGEAEAVLALLDAVPEAERSPGDELVRGHALLAVGKRDDAVASYTRIAESGALDERALKVLLEGLQVREADPTIALLKKAKSDALTPALRALVEDPGWWPRHHAVRLLTERGEGDGLDHEKLAIIDVDMGPNCGTRRYGVKQVEEHGHSDAALEALKRAGERDDNGCIKKKHLAAATAAVKKRMAGKDG